MQNIKVDVGFYLIIASAVLVIPLKLLLGWLIAVAVHELCHYLALRFCNVEVYKLRICVRGVIMDTAPMDNYKELICALAGPLGGLSLLLLRHWMPFAAICGFVHSCYNLLPVPPLDGGRALRCIFLGLCNLKVVEKFLANHRNK